MFKLILIYHIFSLYLSIEKRDKKTIKINENDEEKPNITVTDVLVVERQDR